MEILIKGVQSEKGCLCLRINVYDYILVLIVGLLDSILSIIRQERKS